MNITLQMDIMHRILVYYFDSSADTLTELKRKELYWIYKL